jgi:hypothetical protein
MIAPAGVRLYGYSNSRTFTGKCNAKGDLSVTVRHVHGTSDDDECANKDMNGTIAKTSVMTLPTMKTQTANSDRGYSTSTSKYVWYTVTRVRFTLDTK